MQVQELRSERERIVAQLAYKDEEVLMISDITEAAKDKTSDKDYSELLLYYLVILYSECDLALVGRVAFRV